MSKFKNIEYHLETKKTRNEYDFYMDYKDGGHGEIWTKIEPFGFIEKNNKYTKQLCINLCEFQPHNWQSPKTPCDKTRQRKGFGEHILNKIIQIIRKSESVNIIITRATTIEMKHFVEKHNWKKIQQYHYKYIS